MFPHEESLLQVPTSFEEWEKINEIEGMDIFDKIDKYLDPYTQKEFSIQSFEQNFELAIHKTKDILRYIEKNKLKYEAIFLNVINSKTFNFLFIIREKDYLSNQFDKVYLHSHSKREEAKKSKIDTSFIFMPFLSNLNLDELTSDGYTRKYASKTHT